MGLVEDLPAAVFLLFGFGVALWGFWPDLTARFRENQFRKDGQ